MKAKVLFVTTDYSYFTKPIFNALKDLDYNVKIFDYFKPNLITRIIGFTANQGLISPRLAKKKLKSIINTSLISKVKQFKPHYLLVVKGETLSPRTIRKITKQGVTTINWYPDWFALWGWLKNNAQAYSYFITSCLETYKRLEKAKITNYYLPFAGTIYQSKRKCKKIYPVTFVGQYTKKREKFLSAIKGFGIEIWGYKWKNSQLKSVYHGPVSVASAHKIIRQSKIVVNPIINHKKQQPNQVNVRTFETTGQGTFLLTQYIPLLRRYFKIGSELVTFTNTETLRKKVKFYLTNNKEREKIALAGFKRTKTDHNFKKRLKQLFDIVNKYER